MTEVIRLKRASVEHMTKQPEGLRYAVFCDAVLRGTLDGACPSQRNLGHIGDFSNYREAKEAALNHPHGALISFYPADPNNKAPSTDFIDDFNKQEGL